MVRVRLLALLVLLCTGAALVPAASAQERPAALISAKQRERERKAMSGFAAGRYEEALNIYADLYADYHDPIYLRNIGRCHSKLKAPDKAIASFEEYLRRYKRITALETDEVQSWIRDMKAMQQATAAAAGPATPLPATGAPSPPPTQAAPQPPAPPFAAAPPAASTQPLGAGPVGMIQTAPAPRDGNRTIRIVGIGALAVGVAALAAGGVFMATSWSKYNASKSGNCGGDGCRNAADSIDARATLSKLFFIGGGVVAAAGTTMIFLFPVQHAERSAPLSGFGIGTTLVY